MKITLLQVGKTEDESLRTIISNFENRLKHYVSFETITIPDIKNSKNLTPQQFKEKEAEQILKHIKEREFIILLDEYGKEYTSIDFANFLQQKMNQSLKEICFIIGGAFGVSDNIKKIANVNLSSSKMTFPHQLIRIVFIEQLYRAMTIHRNEPYHNPNS